MKVKILIILLNLLTISLILIVFSDMKILRSTIDSSIRLSENSSLKIDDLDDRLSNIANSAEKINTDSISKLDNLYTKVEALVEKFDTLHDYHTSKISTHEGDVMFDDFNMYYILNTKYKNDRVLYRLVFYDYDNNNIEDTKYIENIGSVALSVIDKDGFELLRAETPDGGVYVYDSTGKGDLEYQGSFDLPESDYYSIDYITTVVEYPEEE